VPEEEEEGPLAPDGLSGGIIAAIVIGAVVLVAIIVVIVVFAIPGVRSKVMPFKDRD